MSKQWSDVSSSSLPPATVLHVFTDRCSAVLCEMSYGLFLPHTCGIKEDESRASETAEINAIIHCCVLVLQAYADVSVDATLTKPSVEVSSVCASSLQWAVCQQLHRDPLPGGRHRGHRLSQLHGRLALLLKLFFFNYFCFNEPFFKPTTQQSWLLSAFSFLKLLDCVRVRQKKKSIFAPTQDSRFRRWAGTFSDSYLMK